MNPLFHTGFSISDSLKSVRKSVLIYETIIIRVSLYSAMFGRYAGKEAIVQEIVLNNISKYMQMIDLEMLGVSLLYYKGNVSDCVKLSFELYKRLIKSGRRKENFNIQFKRAFVLNDPRIFSQKIHRQNFEMVPNVTELETAIKLKKELSLKYEEFGHFLDECTNYNQLEIMAVNGTDAILDQTAKNRIIPDNFEHCYVSLVSRLITPDGYVYTCPTIAEHRERELALGHITDSKEVFNNTLPHYYKCLEPWCNSYYCRHCSHNEIVENYFEKGVFPEYDSNIRNDRFF